MSYKIIDIIMNPLDEMNVKRRQIITAVLDSSADLESLGTGYCPGSVAIVADKDAPVYMLNASGEWKEI